MKKTMYATVRRYEAVPDPKKAAEEVEKKFVPFISALPGFIEYFWIDLSAGSMMSITVFKTLNDAIAANEKSRAFVKDNLSSALPPATRMDAGKIVAYKGKL